MNDYSKKNNIEFDYDKILGKVLFSHKDIQEKVRDLGKRITYDYTGKELIVICILRGAVFFLTDLVRNIRLPFSIDFIGISSYGINLPDSGIVKLTKDLEENIFGKHVLIVEDIIDTGLTLGYLIRNLKSREPQSIEVCALIDREVRRIADLDIKYNAFKIAEKYVVGYGLDYKQKFRNLESIYELRTDAVKKDIEEMKSSLNI